MSSKEKLIKRFCSLPKDFTFDELERVFAYYGFVLDKAGHTSGSRVEFVNRDRVFKMHRPHPGNIVKPKVLLKVYHYLYRNGYGVFEV